MVLQILFYTLSTFGFSAPPPQSKNPVVTRPPSVPAPPSSKCYIYESLNVGDCSALESVKNFANVDLRDYQYPASSDSRYQKPVTLIDLKQVSENTQLAKDFKLKEFMQLYKGRYAIFSESAVNKIQSMRDRLGNPIRINSGYRSPAYNKSVGGVQFSRHQFGDAVDIAGASVKKLGELCREAGASYVQLYKNHTHCDWRNAKLDETFFGQQKGTVLSKASFKSLQETLSGKPKLSILDGELRLGEEVTLQATIDNAEEGHDDLFTEWEVVLPSGERVQTEDSHLHLKNLTRGVYTIKVTVGGYVSTQEEFFIE